jgi:hypothetical protein
MLTLISLERYRWTKTWWRTGEVIVQNSSRSWATKTAHLDKFTDDIISLGCTGQNVNGTVDWIGWDLDVGHGKTAYASTHIAIAAARMIRERVGQTWTEIRLSKSGKGVHVRRLLERPITLELCRQKAKGIANELGIRADPTALSRQAFWLWTRNAPESGFKLIEPAEYLAGRSGDQVPLNAG